MARDISNGRTSEKAASRPPTMRYRALLRELHRIDKHLESSGDKLQSAAAAVLAVNHFLSEDRFVKTSGVGKALRLLSDQLGDAYVGSKQTIFIKEIPRGVRPTLAADNHRGMIVLALDTLIEAKIKNAEAAKFIQSLLKEAGFKYRGKAVTSALLLTWREQIGDSSPAAATETMRRLKEGMPVMANSAAEAKEIAKGFVEVVARRNSN
jgi:hypothetical protein